MDFTSLLGGGGGGAAPPPKSRPQRPRSLALQQHQQLATLAPWLIGGLVSRDACGRCSSPRSGGDLCPVTHRSQHRPSSALKAATIEIHRRRIGRANKAPTWIWIAAGVIGALALFAFLLSNMKLWTLRHRQQVNLEHLRSAGCR